NTAGHEFPEGLGISLAEVLDRTIYEFNTKLRNTLCLFQYSAPQLVIEEVNLARNTYADPCRRPVDRERSSRKIRLIPDLPGYFQNALARSFVNAAAPV